MTKSIALAKCQICSFNMQKTTDTDDWSGLSKLWSFDDANQLLC